MADQGQQFSVQRIYVKDISFETPMGAEVFKNKWEPKIQLDMNTKTNDIGDGHYEVVLSLTVTAKLADDKIGFLAEIQQAGIFHCIGFQPDQLRQLQGVNCPDILFPYAREALDSLAVKGSFPPLMLSPMNFEALFKQALSQQQQEQKH